MIKRGAEETSKKELRNLLISKCKAVVACGSSSDPKDISIDYDAMSFEISTQGYLDERKKIALKSFLFCFGSRLSKIGIPHMAVGARKGDSIFGCSRNQCQHLSSKYQSEEIIIIETPVKIALHKSCKVKILNYLRDKHCIMSPSANPDICFDPNIAANKPTFGLIVDAIVESCFVNNENFIHVADIGMKIPIHDKIYTTENHLTGPSLIDDLFNSVKQLREHFDVQLLQVDIAFTLQYPKNHFAQISCERKKKMDPSQVNRSVFYKSKLENFSIHTTEYARKKNKKFAIIDRGTVRISKTDWATSPTCKILISSAEDDDNEFDQCTDFDFIRNAYQSSTNTRTTTRELAINAYNIYSGKFYSTVAHAILQTRSSIPLSPITMGYLEDRSFRQLQQMVVNIYKSFSRGATYATETGIGWRSEISIRPSHHEFDHQLRFHGHLNDILVHVYLALHDSFKGVYKMHCEMVSIPPVQSKILTLIHQLEPYLKRRGSRPFNQVYNQKMVSWLKAYMSLILLSAGYAPSYKTVYITSWINEDNAFDPFKQIPQLIKNNSTHIQNNHAITNVEEIRGISEKLRIILTKYFSNETVIHLMAYVEEFTNSTNPLQCYQHLSLVEKLSFTSNNDDIISQLSINNEQPEDIQIPKDASGQIYNKEEDPWEFVMTNNPESELVMLQAPSKVRLDYTTNPTASAIQSLSSLANYSDSTNSVFMYHLSEFILKCHEHSLVLPCQLHPLKNFKDHQDDTKLASAYKSLTGKDSKFSNVRLRVLCSNLDVTIRGPNLSNDTYIQCLCFLYHFPCHGVKFDIKTEMRNNIAQKMNAFINDIFSRDIVFNIPNENSVGHMSFYRNIDKLKISILRRDHLIKDLNEPLELESRTESSFSCYDILSIIFNVKSSYHIRNTIVTFLKSKIDISNFFLLETGKKNDTFSNVSNVTDLEMKYKFSFSKSDSFSNTTIMEYTKFVPQVIFPIICLLYKKDVTYYEVATETASLHVYHNKGNRVITYKFNTINIMPRHDSVIFVKDDDQYTHCSITSNDNQIQPQLISYDMLSLWHRHDNNPPFGVNSTKIFNGLSNHPWKRSRKKNTIAHCMVSFMKEIEHTIFTRGTQDDELYLNEFIEEIHSDINDMTWAELLDSMFDPATLEGSDNLKKTKTEYIQTIQSPQEGDNFMFLCPLFCLKYKIPIAIWTSINEKETLFFTYDIWTEKVITQVSKGYHFFQNITNIVYLRMTKKTKAFFIPPTGHPIRSAEHYQKLIHKFSFTDDYFLDLAVEKFEHEEGMNIHNRFHIPKHHPLGNTIKHHLIPISMVIKNSIRQQWAFIVIFPYNEVLQKWETCFMSDESIHHEAEQVSSNILEHICTHVTRDLYTLNSLDYPSIPSSQGGFMMLLLMYISHLSEDFHIFKLAVSALYLEHNLIEKTKQWAINYIHTDPCDPQWLCQIIPSEDVTTLI